MLVSNLVPSETKGQENLETSPTLAESTLPTRLPKEIDIQPPPATARIASNRPNTTDEMVSSKTVKTESALWTRRQLRYLANLSCRQTHQSVMPPIPAPPSPQDAMPSTNQQPRLQQWKFVIVPQRRVVVVVVAVVVTVVRTMTRTEMRRDDAHHLSL